MRKIFEFCFGVLYFVVFFKILALYGQNSVIAYTLLGAGYGGITGCIYEEILKRRRLKILAAAQEAAE